MVSPYAGSGGSPGLAVSERAGFGWAMREILRPVKKVRSEDEERSERAKARGSAWFGLRVMEVDSTPLHSHWTFKRRELLGRGVQVRDGHIGIKLGRALRRRVSNDA